MIFAIQNKGGVGIDNGMPLAFYMGTVARSAAAGITHGINNAGRHVRTKGWEKFNWNDFIPNFNEDNKVKEKAFVATHNKGVLTSIPDTALLASIYKQRDPRMMETSSFLLYLRRLECKSAQGDVVRDSTGNQRE